MRQVAMVPKTQKGRHRLPLKLLLLTTALTGVWVLRTPGNNPFASTKSATGQEKAVADKQKAEAEAGAERRQAAARPALEEEFLVGAKGTERPFKLALDEVVVKKANGQMTSVRLNPIATRETLESRIADLKGTDTVYPVAYPVGVERNDYTRRIITPDITIQMPDGATEVPPLPQGLAIKVRPDYAPDMAVLEAKDSFTALDLVEQLKQTSTLALAEIQMAVQRQPRALPNDTLINNQWHLKANGQNGVTAGVDINVETIWGYPIPALPADDLGYRGTGIRIAVIDDGLDTAHLDFAGNIDTANDFDFNDQDNDPNPTTPLQDADNHGTSVAGNIAARGNNNRGVSGSAPEGTLVGLRLIGAPTTDLQEANAMAYLNTGANLIQIKNNSWGPARGDLAGPGTLALAALKKGVEEGRANRGTIYVFAGGNDGEYLDNVNYDGWASSMYTIGVGAIDSSGKQAVYSERGASLAVVAPSSGVTAITTTDRTGALGYNPDGDYNLNFGGTSSAAPTAAGVIALVLQANPNLGWRDVKEIIMRSAKLINPTDTEWSYNGAAVPFHFNPKFGAGLIDATAAVNLAKTWVNLPVQTTFSTNGQSGTIPDNLGTSRLLQFALTPDKSIRVEHAVVTLGINHPRPGDLEVTLESPRGTISKLVERHGFTFAPASTWGYTSVQNWGENSVGTWRVNVRDRVTGQSGSVTSSKLELFGSVEPPKNPPPSITISKPLDGTSESPGSLVKIEFSSIDKTATNTPGTLKLIELYDKGAFIAKIEKNPVLTTTDTYFDSFTVTPGLGTHIYTIVVTDNENAKRTSAPVTLTIANQPPVITTAEVTPGVQAFADQVVSVSSVNVTDNESDPITLSYQWQRSRDTFTFENVNQITSTLTSDPANAGYVWRCVVKASDGPGGNITTRVTNAVNIVARPQGTVVKGDSYSYNSGLVIRATDQPLLRQVVFNEFSQGSVATSPYTSSEWIELLTLKAGSMKGWRLTDAAGNQLAFTNNAAWNNIPAGTVIIIYNGGAIKDPLLPADDFDVSDKSLVISSKNSTYFIQGTFWPDLGNSGDAITLRDNEFNPVAQFSYGDNNSVQPHFPTIDTGAAAQYLGNTDLGNDDPANWKITTALNTRGVRADGDLPFEFGGPWTQPPTNMELTGVTNFYGNYGGDTSPGAAKFSKQTDSMVINFNSQAEVLSYTIAATGNGGYNTVGQFRVMEATATGPWTTVRDFTNKNYTEASFRDPLLPGTRRVLFIYNVQAQGSILIDKVGIYPTNPLFLTVTPSTFSETAGDNAAVGQVSLLNDAPADLTITIVSSDLTAATVPVSVVIPSGQRTAVFPIAAVDDLLSDGPQLANITVSAVGYTPKTNIVVVTDNEPSAEGVTPKAGNSPLNIAWIAALRDGSLFAPTPFSLGAGSDQLPANLTLDALTGVISGTVSATVTEGIYNIIVVRSNVLGETVSVSYALTVTGAAPAPNPNTPPGAPAGSHLATYSTRSEGSNAGTADNTDSDGDGLGDLAEYYLGSNPDANDASAFMPVVESDANSVWITYRRSNQAAQSLQGTVEWSTTLPNGPWSTVGVKEVILERNTFWTKVRASVPNPSTEAKKYLRLRIEPKGL